MDMKRPKRPTESKPGKTFQTGSSPTDSTRTDLSYSYRVLGGQNKPDFEIAGWWQKPTRRAKCKKCAQCGVVKEFGKNFHKTQLGRGGRFLACKGGIRTTNPKPQQPLIGMIFTTADPRFAGRLDDKHGGDIIVTVERVREAIAVNAVLADEST